jgi:hypothetical protein
MHPFKRGLFFCGGERSEASVKAAKRFDAAEKSAPFEWMHPGDPRKSVSFEGCIRTIPQNQSRLNECIRAIPQKEALGNSVKTDQEKA